MPSAYTKKNGTYRGKQKFIPDPKKYLYNIDTLWLNVDSYYYDDVMSYGLRDLLEEGRNSYTDDGDIESVIECKIDGYENPVVFQVMGGNPPLYQYSIRNDSLAIYFSKNRRENQLPMRVQLNQHLLWELGVEGAYMQAIEVLKSLSFMPFDVRLNRIDFAVHSDQFHWTLEDMKSFDYPRNIKDDNQPNFYKVDICNGTFETMMVGDRSRLAMRIYDKSKEIEAKKKFYFYNLYSSHGMDIDNVWNIEIEVRRPYLKDLCEEDDDYTRIFDDFNYCLAHDGLSRLWSHLMTKYHHDSVHWSMLTKLDKHFKFDTVHGLSIHKDIHSNFEKEIPQILGRLSSAVVTEQDFSLSNAIKILYESLPKYEERQKKKGKKIITFEQRVADKKSRIMNDDINLTLTPQQKKDFDILIGNQTVKNNSNNQHNKEKHLENVLHSYNDGNSISSTKKLSDGNR